MSNTALPLPRSLRSLSKAKTDRANTGLAPEIPEDLYFLIKKVCKFTISLVVSQNVQHPNNFEGRRRPQTPRAQQKGQGLQVPPHSHRVSHPSLVAVLQDRWGAASDLEV
jgi:hypothetical protein